MNPYVVIDGEKYVPEFVKVSGEVLTISEVRPVYTLSDWDSSEQTSLLLGFDGMPRTRFRPGMKIRVIVEP